MYTAHTVAHQGHPIRLPLRKYLQVASIAVVGIAISIGVMRLLDNSLQTRRQMEFDKAVNSVVSRIEQGTATYENVLRNLDALYRNSVQVVRDVFELYSTVPAESNPAIRGIGYANIVTARELEEFTFYARSERYYDYTVHPPGSRPQYIPVLYAVPYPERRDVIGYDLLSRAELADAISRAQQKRSIVSSKVFDFGTDTASLFLMIATQQQGNVNVLLPTAHSRFDGILFVEIDIPRFLRTSLGDSVASDRNIEFRVLDDWSSRSPSVVASFGVDPEGWSRTDPQALVAERTIPIGDRSFKLEFRSAPTLTHGSENYFGIFALVSGLITTAVLCGFVLSVMSAQQRAVALADRITEGNRRILESSRDIIGTLTLDGRWQTVNPAIEQVLGYQPLEVNGTLVTQYIASEPERVQFLSRLADRSGQMHSIEVGMICRDAAVRWVSWNISIAYSEGIAYIVGRDVTIERKAREELQLRSRQVHLAEQLALEANASKSAFIQRLTRYLRSSLVTTLDGMHQMVMTMDATNDRQLRFVKLANESSDRLFAIVSDLLDIAQDEQQRTDNTAQLASVLRRAEQLYTGNGGLCSLVERSVDGNTLLHVEETVVSHALANLLTAFSSGMRGGTIEVTTIINTREQVLELQVLAQYSSDVATMIARFNRCQDQIIEALSGDSGDVLFRLGLAATQIRRVGGTFSVETLGEDGGNVALLTLPIAQ
ncbi:MAG: CHASE domain-containing protein [Chlorobi bacterium]|nr:CHASE domain-containing protein [Chlorobiota bacterium]